MECGGIRSWIEVNRGFHRQYLVSCHDEGTVFRSGSYRTEPGEATEGGKQCRMPSNDETGQRLPLKASAHQGQARMHMAGQTVSIGRVDGLVPEYERRHKGRRIDAIDVEIGRWIARMTVMVAPDQQNFEGTGQAPPPPKLRQCMRCDSARLGMEEVAQHHHAAGVGALQRAVEPSQI